MFSVSFPGCLTGADSVEVLQEKVSRAGKHGFLRIYVPDSNGLVNIKGYRRDAVAVQVAREYAG